MFLLAVAKCLISSEAMWTLMAKITFLGTGGDAYTVGRQLLGAGGIIVEIASNQFHLDPGPGSLPAAKEFGIDLRHNVAVLVSHNHLNHAHDLNAVLSAMTYGGLDPHGVVLASKSVVNSEHSRLHPHNARFAEKVLSVSDTPRVGINSVDIRITPTSHSDSTGVGFILSGRGHQIGYTSDTRLTQEVAEAFSGVDTLIVCVSRLDSEDRTQNLSPADVIELVNIAQPKTVVLTHFSQQLLKYGTRRVGREISSEVDAHVIVASDGGSVDTAMYR